MDSLAKLQAELAEERQWRQDLANLSVDQQREIEQLKMVLEKTEQVMREIMAKIDLVQAAESRQN